MRIATTIFVLSVALLTFVTASVPTAAHAPFQRIVAFGTSLSDSGQCLRAAGRNEYAA